MVPILEGIILSGTAQRIDDAHSFLILRPQEGHRREACSVTVRNSSGQALGSQEETEKFQLSSTAVTGLSLQRLPGPQ